MKIKLFSAILASVVAWTAFVPLQAATTTIANGTEVYIRYNAGTADNPVYYYLNGGVANQWAARAVTAEHGLPFTMVKQSGTATPSGTSTAIDKYKLQSVIVANGDEQNQNKWFCYNGGYKLNKNSGYWQFVAVDAEKNQYKLFHSENGKKYIKPNSIGTEVSGVDFANAQVWELVTKEQLEEELSAANRNTPIDATFYITDPDFAAEYKESKKGLWKLSPDGTTNPQSLKYYVATPGTSTFVDTQIFANGGNTGSYIQLRASDQNNRIKTNAELHVVSGGKCQLRQALSGLKNGWYRVSAYGVTNSATNACYLFADNGSIPQTATAFPSGTASDYKAAYALFTGGSKATYQRYIDIQVTDGTLAIGFKSADNPTVASTSFVDYFELYYYGTRTYTLDYTLEGTHHGSFTYDAGDNIELPTITERTGYTFSGWKENGSAFTSTTMPARNVSLTGTYDPHTYTIHFNGNGKTSGSMSDQSFDYDETKALTSNAFTRAFTVSFSDGTPSATATATFNGWATSAGGSVVYTDGQTVSNLTATDGATIDLYPNWTDGSITLPGQAAQAGSACSWYNSENVRVGAAGDTYTPSADVTLTSKWEYIHYTIHYHLNGGTNNASNPVDYTVADAFTLAAPTRTGYNFAGWYADEGLNTAANTTITKGSTGERSFYAKWTPVTYTVSFNGNGNTSGSMSNQTHTYDATQSLTAIGYTKTGYTFAGWATAANGAKAYDDKASVSNLTSTQDANIELFALWTANTYTVTFYGNGNTGGSMTKQTFTYDVAQELTANKFTKTYYTFAGWATSADGTVVYTNSQSVSNLTETNEGNVDLYAKWTPTTYTITYSLNNGTLPDGVSNPTEYNIETATFTLPTPTRTGYDFEGWHTQNNNTSEKVTQIAQGTTGNKTFYARWTAHTYSVRFNGNGATSGTMSDQPFTYGTKQKLTANAFARTYTVTYNYNGATGDNGTASATGTFAFDKWTINADGSGTSFTNQKEVNNLTSTDGGIFNLYVKWKNGSVTLPTPTRTGYTFKGWYSDASLNNKVNDGGKSYTPSADITLYAKWEAITYTITYNLNGGTNNANNPATYNIETATITLANPTRTGYDFEGWHTQNNNTSEKVTQIAQGSTGNKTLYARWTPITYSITYYLDGGTLASGKTSYTIETNDFTLNKPTKTGYTFAGWTGSNGTTEQTSVTVAKGSTGDKNYTAHWTANTYAVKFNGNGSTSGSMSNQSFTYDAAQNLTANAFTKTGYTFAGWATTSGGTVVYADGASVSNLTATANGTYNLYAKWTANTYSVHFVGTGSTGGSMDDQTGFTYDVNKTLTANGFERKIVVTFEYNNATGGNDDVTKTATATFYGWATTEGGTRAYTNAQSVKNLTAVNNGIANLYALWTNGSVTLPTPTRTGYTFGGWYSDETLATKVNDGGKSYTPTADITLYAKWTPYTYTVKFSANGGTAGGATMDNMSFTYDEPQTLSANIYTRTGYTFIGWNTAANGSGTAYSDKETVVNLTTTKNATVTLYAQWFENFLASPWTLVEGETGDNILANPNNYLFIIGQRMVDDNGVTTTYILSLGDGTAGHQGTDYKTIVRGVTTDAAAEINSLASLWEIYTTDDEGQYVLSNASAREGMLLTEGEGEPYFRFKADGSSTITLDKAQFTIDRMGPMCHFKTAQGGLQKWDETSNDLKVSDGEGTGYAIYAISRSKYYQATQNIYYNASMLTPKELPLLLPNPCALGEADKTPVGWTHKGENRKFVVKPSTATGDEALFGKNHVEYMGNAIDTIGFTLTDILEGYYILDAAVRVKSYGGGKLGGVSGATETSLATTSANLYDERLKIVLQVKKEDETLEIFLGHTAATAYGSSKYLKLGDFTLTYLGTEEVTPAPLTEGEFFIRTNIGTKEVPVYRYLNSGGNNWGTDPVLDEHGMRFTFKKNATGNTYALQTELLRNAGNNDELTTLDGWLAKEENYFNGWRLDHAKSESKLKFTPAYAGSTAEYHMHAGYADGQPKPKNKEGNDTTAGFVSYDIEAETFAILSHSDSASATVWEFVTTAQRLKELQYATADNPLDATFYLKDPSFSRANYNKKEWHVTNNDQTLLFRAGASKDGGEANKYENSYYDADGNECAKDACNGFIVTVGSNVDGGVARGNKFDFNVKVTGQSDNDQEYDIYQISAIDDLPAGRYRLKVHGYSNREGGAVLYAKDGDRAPETCTLDYSVAGKASADNQVMAAYLFSGQRQHGWLSGMTELQAMKNAAIGQDYKTDGYCDSIDFLLKSNTLRVGIKGTLGKDDYAIFDNFELYFLSETHLDPTHINQGKNYYLYNVDAGQYLTYTAPKVEGTNSVEGYYPVLSTAGRVIKFEKIEEEPGTYYIKTGSLYLGPSINAGVDDRDNPVTLLQFQASNVKDYDPEYFKWKIESSADSTCYITDKVHGRRLEWTGDQYFLVYAGFANGNDAEPRGNRWYLFEQDDYLKNKQFTTTGFENRKTYWPTVRSARLNMRNRTNAIDGLSEAYNALDAVWSRAMSIKAIAEKSLVVQQVIMNALETQATPRDPIDVSFKVANALMNSLSGWTSTPANSFTAYERYVTRYDNDDNLVDRDKKISYSEDEGLAMVGRYYASGTVAAGDTVKIVGTGTATRTTGTPGGRYKATVQVRSISSLNPTGKCRFYLKSSTTKDNKNINPVDSEIDGQVRIITSPTFIFPQNDGKTKNLQFNLEIMSDSIAFDNFQILYCGPKDSEYKLNADKTELTCLGNLYEEDFAEIKSKIAENESTLGVVYIKENDEQSAKMKEPLNTNNANWKGNNVLVYTDYDASMVNGDNVVRQSIDAETGEATYSCERLVLTDKMPLYVPQEFTATSATYTRVQNTGTICGTLVMPFDMTKVAETYENNFSFYTLKGVTMNQNESKIEVQRVTVSEENPIPANTPVFFEARNATFTVNEENAFVHKTEYDASNSLVHNSIVKKDNIKKTIESTQLIGSYDQKYYVGTTAATTSYIKNNNGLCANDCYYLKNNKFWHGNCYFSIASFRAFIYYKPETASGAAAIRPAVFEIEFLDEEEEVNGIPTIAEEGRDIVGFYDAQGVRHDQPQKGVNIVRRADGSNFKILVK